MKVKPVALAVIELHLSELRHHLVGWLVSQSLSQFVTYSVKKSVKKKISAMTC